MKAKAKAKVKAGLFDNSTDWGTIGTYGTERGAIRAARKYARAHSTQTGYKGYGPTITLQDVDAITGEPISERRTVKAW